jgi:DNA-3-methyladenine glycosylase II
VAVERLQPEATRHWLRTEPTMARLSQAHPLPDPGALGPAATPGKGFAALVRSVAHQQVSIAAGAAIHGRLVRTLGGAVTPRRVLDRDPETLRAAGLSGSKATTVRELARLTLEGEVRFRQFPRLADEAIVGQLVQVKGIGPWTAKMFLLFHLGRPDVFAPEDLGLRLAVAQAYGVPEARAAARMERLRPLWAPYNSVAARVLWQSRRALAAPMPPA